MQGGRYTKLIDSRYRYNRYRYHKNAIISKDISPLVGLRVFSLRLVIPLIAGTTSSLYSLSKPSSDYN